jgi:hypothetical protein
MNRYYCTKCNKESVMGSYEIIINAKCCDKDTLVKHRLVSLKGKEDPKITKLVETNVVSPLNQETLKEKPKTRLDVSSGPVTAKVN